MGANDKAVNLPVQNRCTEVSNTEMTVADEKIRGLNVPMHDATAVDVAECQQQRGDDLLLHADAEEELARLVWMHGRGGHQVLKRALASVHQE